MVSSEFLVLLFSVILFTIFLCSFYLKRNKIILRKSLHLEKLKYKLIGLHPRIKDIEFVESDSSFTENKEVIFMCMRDENGEVYDENTLTYVCLHEIAHVLTRSEGHTKEFYTIFNDLLRKAEQGKLYDPNRGIAQIYCGVSVPEHARKHRAY